MISLLLALSLATAPSLALEPADLSGLSADSPSLSALAAEVHASELARLSQHKDWQVRQGAALVSAFQEDAALAQELLDLPLTVTRARIGRVQHPAVGTPLARAVMAERLQRGQDTDLDRLGLAHVLAVDEAMDPVVLAGLIQAEADPEVRAVLVWGWRYNANTGAAEAGLIDALSDASPTVRVRAAEAAAYQQELALDAALVGALGDGAPEVRAKAARALGWREASVGFDALRPLLGDADAEVRLQALSAMQRIQAEQVAGLPELSALAADPDPRVARLAAKVQ